jgi:AraC-like DNA-binding protein
MKKAMRTMTHNMRNADGPASQNVISFGPFRLFVAERLLVRCVPVHLGKRALEILAVLVERPTEVISTENLVARVWPDLTIREGSLRYHIAALRKALGDRQSGARYVANVSGQGYCFVAPTLRATLTPSAGNVPLAIPTAQFVHENSNLAPLNAARSRSSPALDGQRLRRVLEFVEANLETDIRVKDLAYVAALSRFHFSRAFRHATGQTPHRFVRTRRLEKARELLVKGDATLAEIALICNFSSQATFTKAFSRAVGLPPGEYRHRCR